MNTTLQHYPPAPPEAGAVETPLTREAIAERAREIWIAQGRPQNCDDAIWLEAEAELVAIQQKRYRHPHLNLAGRNGA